MEREWGRMEAGEKKTDKKRTGTRKREKRARVSGPLVSVQLGRACDCL